MKKLFTSVFLFITVSTFSQQELNDYKYVIVPIQFDVFKSANQYKTSTLIKHLLTDKNLNALYSDKLPNELVSNRCLGLIVDLEDNSNMFTTKSILLFKDCNGKVVYSTREGSSKLKEYDASYSEAINDAIGSLAGFNYSFAGKSSKSEVVSNQKDIANLSENKIEESIELNEAMEIEVPEEPEVVETKQLQVNTEKASSNASLYAQSIKNGYQLVDSTPKIVMKIFKTSQQNVFLATNTNGTSGVVYADNGTWFYEYYSNDVLQTESLDIKF